MHLFLYIPWLILQIFLAGYATAKAAFGFATPFHPVVVRYPLRVSSNLAITAFSTSITITPGTLSIGLRQGRTATDPTILLVHAVFGEDPAEVFRDLADMEERLAPSVKSIDHGVPGQGDNPLRPEHYEYPDPDMPLIASVDEAEDEHED